MKATSGKKQTLAIRIAVFAVALALLPTAILAQGTQTDKISAVTELYSFESLLPAMSSGDLGTMRDIASWCLDMANLFKTRLADAQKQVDLQREAKRAEIKALEARAKGAGKAKADVEKAQYNQEIRTQKAELDILDAVKELTVQESAASADFEAAGKSIKNVAEAYRDLKDNHERAERDHEKAIESAAQAGLAAPTPPGPDYPANDKGPKALSEAGKNISDLGQRLMKLAKARQGVLSAWEKQEKAKVGK
jgi:DNA repair exonuclease SbcCD ATPase subunit